MGDFAVENDSKYLCDSAIRWIFTLRSLKKDRYRKMKMKLDFLNCLEASNPKNLDPSCRMNLNFQDCFGGKKLSTYATVIL